ncbi:hypothetical protein CC86DRAFT_409762 [Ophiobolus disseminans]|uniref:Uncharacterized protein n=1 Tax=Ophiobolus disseminans TaxID=1469910 RepID=A0A6A6ZPG3_9PLEO|nr:hypothetical protein CC86DRAFT_409762 [Ophiobolus disseminans]
MTISRLDYNIALPHAGLLLYIRRTALSSQRPDTNSPSLSSDEQASHNAQGRGNRPIKDDDQESNLGFWGEHRHDQKGTQSVAHLDLVKRGYHGAYAFCCFWFAFSICILGAFSAFFVLDLVFTQLGMGTGMATWMMHRNVGQESASYEMHFCLATPNRQAPGPQTWRYIEGDGIVDCTTEALTLVASSSEVWKLFPDDTVSIRDDLPLRSGYEVDGKVLSVVDKVRLAELGDDLAEEGKRI